MNAPHSAIMLKSSALLTVMVTSLAILIVVSTLLIALTIARATRVVPPDVMVVRRYFVIVTIMNPVLST